MEVQEAKKNTARKLSYDPMWRMIIKLEIEMSNMKAEHMRLRQEALAEVANAKAAAKEVANEGLQASLSRLEAMLMEEAESS